jgi:CTP synthase
VQVIPHVTNAIKERLWRAANKSRADIHIVEIGGTVGDYEGVVFHEAMRQLQLDIGHERVLYIHLVFLPYIEASGEVKTKPAQNSVRELRNIGIQPDMLVVRSDHAVPKGLISKLSQFTNVPENAILPLPTLPSVYEVPLVMQRFGFDRRILEHFVLAPRPARDGGWRSLVRSIKVPKPKVRIAMVGKYLGMKDTYMSLVEALKAAAWANRRELDLWWVDSENIESGKLPIAQLKKAAGIIVPGGFGKRGTEGKIRAIQFAREKRIPYLGLCLGMQLAVVEFARNVLGLKGATSEEFEANAKDQVIHFMAEQKFLAQKGGTMRLGAWPCALAEESKVRALYGTRRISERHRHRYEFNNAYRERCEDAGLRIVGTTPDKMLVEIVELKDHPFFIGVQFHPEFQSRPTRPHPLFQGFLEITKGR